MHIVIAAITAIAGLLWALNSLQRSGFQFSSLNPFLAWRRFQWSRTYGGRPIYKLDRPIDVAAVLLLGVAKADGAITSDQKRELLAMFQSEFSISRDEASDLLLASSIGCAVPACRHRPNLCVRHAHACWLSLLSSVCRPIDVRRRASE